VSGAFDPSDPESGKARLVTAREPASGSGARADDTSAAAPIGEAPFLPASVLEMATMARSASAVDSSGAPSGELRGIFSPDLLGRCISCGFCLPSCPTYRLTGRESSSPRGRITLMRALESGRLPDDDPTLAEESSFCLGCRAASRCPAGVQYGALRGGAAIQWHCCDCCSSRSGRCSARQFRRHARAGARGRRHGGPSATCGGS
jgi:glycolate oxidase iron-sulfur subunit